MMNQLKKFIKLIKGFILPEKYTITVDEGAFQLTVYGQLDGTPAGREVILEQSTELPKDLCNPNIKIVDMKKSVLDIEVIKSNKQWRFIMPPQDILIIPTVKRKSKK